MTGLTANDDRPRPRLPQAGALIRLGLMAAVMAVFLPVIDHGFVALDDPDYVTENRWVRAGLTREGLGWALTSFDAANWHPLTWASHMLDVALFGLNPAGHHLTSLLLHMVNALLFFAVLFRLTGSVGRSALVAALFAGHPLHVESVAWIAERKDVLSTALALAALWFYERYARRPRPVPYLAALLFFLLALTAKPMPLTLPMVMLLLDVWPLRRFGPGPSAPQTTAWLWVEKIPFWVLAMAAGLITLAAQSRAGAVGSLAVYPLPLRLANALWSYLAYIAKMVAPINLAVYYPYQGHWMGVKAGLALVTLGALTTAVWRLRIARPYLLVGWLWYLITLLPVIGLIQVGAQAMADRYTYMPLVGLFIATVWSCADWAAAHKVRPGVQAAAALTLVGLFLIGARVQVGLWKDTLSLFGWTLKVTANNAPAHNAYGLALHDAGRLPAAEGHFLQALRSEPAYTPARINLANLYLGQGRFEAAVALYEQVLRVQPANLISIYNIGMAWERQHRDLVAMGFYTQALAIDPAFIPAHVSLAGLLAKHGRFGAAGVHCRQALDLDPTDAKAHFTLAVVLEKTGKPAAAMDHYRRAVECAPLLTEALDNLGRLLLVQGQVQEALVHFTRVLAINPRQAKAHINLAAALAAAGRLDEALGHGQQALQLAPGSAPAHNVLGVILARCNDPDRAAAHFRAALALDPDDKVSRRNWEKLSQDQTAKGLQFQ
jgi:tetratricopeptide (TPR) repeat protein